MQRIDFGGKDITDLLSKDLEERKALPGKIPATPGVFRLVKEKKLHIVPNYDNALGKMPPTEFAFPNGDKMTMGDEVFKFSEIFFDPERFGETELNKLGVHHLVYRSIQKTNIDVRKDLYANIVLSGGSTLFPGFVERLENELRSLVPASVQIRVVAHPARKYFTWIGGSVLASLTSFPNTIISKQNWDDGSGRVAINKIYS